MKALRSLFSLVVFGAVALFAVKVPIGDFTLVGHFSRIWKAEATKDLVDSLKEESGPAIDRMRRGVEAGLDEANRPDAIPTVTTSPMPAAENWVELPR